MSAQDSPSAASADAVQARYRAILAAATEAVIVIDLQGVVQEFNTAAETMFGYATEQVLGHNINMLMAEPYHSAHDRYLQRYQQTGEARIIGIGREVEGRRQDGSLFPMDLAVGEIRENGLTGFVGLIRDISHDREIEEALTQREAELQLTLDRAPMAIATCALDGSMRSANAACCRLFEASESALENSRIQDCLAPADRPAHERVFQKLARGEIDEHQMSLQFSSHADKRLYIDLFQALVRHRDGTPHFILAEFINRTAEIEAEHEAAAHREQLAQVGRLGLLGEMAAGIAHEINQPLTAVAVYAQAVQRMAQREDCEREVVVETLEKISRQIERASSVIARIRQFTRSTSLSVEAVVPAELLRDIRVLAEVDLRRNGLRLDVDIAENLARVRGDMVQLQQVLLNLIRNAADAMGEKRQGDVIIVTAQDQGQGWVRITVDDSGPGISAEMAEHLFDPFYSSKPDGFGLGLSICKSLIDGHGGEIQHGASPLLGGTRFTLLLPTIDAPAEELHAR